MALIATVVFLAVFVAILLVVTALGSRGQRRKEALNRLESMTLATVRNPGDEGLNVLRAEMLSSLPWLDQLMQNVDAFPRLRRLLLQTDLKWNVAHLLMISLACAVAGGVAAYLRTGLWHFSLAFGLLVGFGPFLFVLYKRAERFGRFEEKLPEALDMMVGAIRAGQSLLAALELAGREMMPPISDEFRKTFDEHNFGLDLKEALLNLAYRVPIHDVQIIVTAILIQRESGGNLAEILDKTAHVIRERFRLKRQIRVHTAQGRLTGWILALLPPILGVLMFLFNPKHMTKLWEDPTGLKMIYFAVCMTLVGGLIIRKIVRIQV
jgi:tight adherence protein B